MVEDHLRRKGVGVVVEAEHLCMSLRGVQAHGSRTVTSAVHGLLAQLDERSRAELFAARGGSVREGLPWPAVGARNGDLGGVQHVAGADDTGSAARRAECVRKSGGGRAAGAVPGCDDSRVDEVLEVAHGRIDPVFDGGAGEVVAAEEEVDRLIR